MILATNSQFKAMELLGYKRWLLRDDLIDIQHNYERNTKILNDNQIIVDDNASADEVVVEQLPTEQSKPTPNVKTEIAQQQHTKAAEKINSHFTIEDIDAYFNKNVTLLKWQVDSSHAHTTMLMPPLWGTHNQLSLFQEEQELLLLTNAMIACGLSDIAYKLNTVNTFIHKHVGGIALGDNIDIKQYVEHNAIVIIINEMLPEVAELQSYLSECGDKNSVSVIHPYRCLQQPMDKANLWHQLINLKAKYKV